MDKVKQILALLKKYHFWIGCVVVALVGLLVWKSSVGKLDTEFKRDSANIEQTLGSLRKIEKPHPNDTWTKGFGDLTDALRKEVKAAWEELYKQQKQEVYIWPKSLGKEFLDKVSAIETNPEEKFPDKLRERYQNMVRHEAEQLAVIVDAPAVAAGFGGAAREMGEGAELGVHRVRWSQLGEIEGTFDFEQPPSTQLILMMQEELWVYQALCKIIKSVNEGSKGAHDAPITEIGDMAIAYMASDNPPGGRRMLRKPLSDGAGGGDSSKQKPDVRSRGRAEEKQLGEEGGDPDAVWKGWRFVKETGEPLMAGEVDSASPEFNLMPFKMHLTIDPHDLDRLLVAFRNSVLPIEVKQVRINPGGGTAATALAGSKPTETMPGERMRHMDKVEVSGVVYLIKPFNPQVLGLTPAEESGGEQPVEGATPAGEAPAGGTPPAEAPAAAPAGG